MSGQRIPGRVEMPPPGQHEPQGQAQQREPGRVEEPTTAMPEQEAVVQPSGGQTLIKKPSLWRKATLMLLLSLFAWMLSSSFLRLLQLWHSHRWLALMLAVIGGLTLFYILRLLLSEWRASKRLDALVQRQSRFRQALQQDDMQLFNRQFAALRSQLEPVYPQQLADYRQDMQQRDTVAARMQLAENTWLRQLDERAGQLIRQEATMVGAAVAVVPHPLLDAVVVLWRSQRLIRQLGQLYGLQPTGLSSWKLLKMALLNTLVVGALDTASELLAEQAGYGVVETAVGKGTVQGVVMGQRMRRLGRQAQMLCRPWPKPDARQS